MLSRANCRETVWLGDTSVGRKLAEIQHQHADFSLWVKSCQKLFCENDKCNIDSSSNVPFVICVKVNPMTNCFQIVLFVFEKWEILASLKCLNWGGINAKSSALVAVIARVSLCKPIKAWQTKWQSSHQVVLVSGHRKPKIELIMSATFSVATLPAKCNLQRAEWHAASQVVYLCTSSRRSREMSKENGAAAVGVRVCEGVVRTRRRLTIEDGNQKNAAYRAKSGGLLLQVDWSWSKRNI